MLDIKAAKKLVLSEMEMLAATDGFRAETRRQAFFLQRPFGGWIFHLGFIPHRGVDVDIVVDVSIRIDAVLDLTNEGLTDVSGAPCKAIAVLGTDLGNLSEGRQKRWTVDSHLDVTTVTASIYAAIQKIGFPFFERYSDMNEVLRTLLSLSPSDWLLSPGHIHRCKQGVALAFLLNAPETIDAGIRHGEKLLSERDSESVPNFFAFVQSLQMKRENGLLTKIPQD